MTKQHGAQRNAFQWIDFNGCCYLYRMLELNFRICFKELNIFDNSLRKLLSIFHMYCLNLLINYHIKKLLRYKTFSDLRTKGTISLKKEITNFDIFLFLHLGTTDPFHFYDDFLEFNVNFH